MSDRDKTLHVEEREDGVAVVRMDVPGESMNTLGTGFAEEFQTVFSGLRSRSSVKAVVVTSGKPGSFIAGADIGMLKAAKTVAEATALAAVGQDALDELAAFPKPIVAAIDGVALGGGLEVALSCHGRVASTNKKTKLGLPEVQLGLLPGAGGTQRLPELIGIQAALDLMLTGKQVDARKAKKLGLVDEVVPASIVVDVAAERALALVGEQKAGNKRSFFDRDELQEMALTDNPLGRKVLFDQAKKQLLSKTHGNYPAPERILEVVRKGLAKGMKAGLQAEREAFGQLAMSPEARALMAIFTSTQELKKDSGTDDQSAVPKPVSSVGMLGAGLMGGGIAYVTAAFADTPVRLKDRDSKGVMGGLSYVRGIVDKRVKRKRLSRVEADRMMTLVTGTQNYSGFKGCDVVIEAVFEDLNLKHRVLQETEAATADDAIFASNTSSIPITEIAEGGARPHLVIGMHYFSPVEKMPLLEIITTDKTAPWVTATCVELGKQQGKTVIVVNDGVGFYTSRILAPFMNEAAHVLAEGVAIERIDRALSHYGFPVGPLKLTDEVGIDVGEKVGKIMLGAFGERMRPPPGFDKLIADDRKGRKNGRGFYLYGDDAKGGRKVDESVYEVLDVEPTKEADPVEIAERCTLQMVNEAALCFGEGILRSARDGDIGAIFGLGFPPFRGGPFHFVDALGAKTIVRKLERFRDLLGADRFEPAAVLVELAKSGGTFYGTGSVKPGGLGQRVVDTASAVAPA